MSAHGELDTERADSASADLDVVSTLDALALFEAADREAARAVAAARDQIAAAIDLVTDRLEQGGRLIYVGAGTSGRLGVLDAVECPPTFLTDPNRVQGRIAGGSSALVRSVEGAEDDGELGAGCVADVTQADVVVGITASGRTPFVHGALDFARSMGAATVFIACVPAAQAPDDAEVSIRALTGPELLTGSTRLKAGTATKMILNRITTIAMARLGKVHGNRMVDVNTHGNAKLFARGVRMIQELGGVDAERASELLERADGRVKLALVMNAFDCSSEDARIRLERAGGFLRAALDES